MKNALLVIDVQKDYFPGGRYELDNTEEAYQNTVTLVKHFRERKEPVIFVQHISRSKDATFFIDGTDGIELQGELQPTENEYLVVKYFPNSFRETNLKEILDQLEVTKLTVCGMMTHMCVDTTVRAADTIGYDVVLVEDACATRALDRNGISVSSEMVEASFMAAIDGSFARVVKTEELL